MMEQLAFEGALVSVLASTMSSRPQNPPSRQRRSLLPPATWDICSTGLPVLARTGSSLGTTSPKCPSQQRMPLSHAIFPPT
jgi:hypothetical protein